MSKNCFQALGNMIRVVHPGSGSWFFTHPGSRGQKCTESRIRIRNTDFNQGFSDNSRYRLTALLYFHLRIYSIIEADLWCSWRWPLRPRCPSCGRPRGSSWWWGRPWSGPQRWRGGCPHPPPADAPGYPQISRLQTGELKRLDQGHLHPLLEHPETNMSRPGIEPGPPASGASTPAKSYSNRLCWCYSEPLQS